MKFKSMMSKKWNQFRLHNGMLCAAVFALVFPMWAADYYWQGGNGGVYAEPTNWTPGAVPASGNTYHVDEGVDCVDPFAQDTVGLKGVLDLGGATQTFTSDIDNVFSSGGTVCNGHYLLTNTGNWETRGGYSFSIGAGAKVEVSGRLYPVYGGSAGNMTIYVKDGGELNLLNNSENQIGRYKNNWISVYVQDGSRLTAKTMRVGWDTNGRGRLHVKNQSEAIFSGMLKISGRDSGGATGAADIQVLNGSRLQAVGGVGYGYYPSGETHTLTVSGGSVLETKNIAGGTTSSQNMNVNFNDAIFVPNTADVNLFDDSYASTKPTFHITGNLLTVSNVVGKVTIGSEVNGAGGFCLTGGEDLEFTVAPTYTGATVVKAGTLTYTGASTTALAVTNGATIVYAESLALTDVALESGATLSMAVKSVEGEISAAQLTVSTAVDLDGVNLMPTGLEDWSDVEAVVLTATDITGTPVLPEGLTYEIATNGEGQKTLSIKDANSTSEATRPVFAEYTGAGTDPMDYTDPANWICYNAREEVVADVAPRYYTVVRVSGATGFTYPEEIAESFPLAALVVTGNVTLMGDCDWRRFGTFAIPEGSVIDLNGHTLDADIPADWSSTVIGSGKVVVDVPADTVYDTRAVFGGATCGFAKQGSGELVIKLMEAEQNVERPLSIAGGKVTLVNESGAELTNCFAVASTGLAGVLDLGGTVQTFSSDPDLVFGNGASVFNGTLTLSSTADWSDEGRTVDFGTNLVMSCAACLNNYTVQGTSVLNFKDGCVCTFTKTSEHFLGRFVGSGSNNYKVNITTGARVEFLGNVRIGCGTRGNATVTVDDAELSMPTKRIQLSNRANGDNNGYGYLVIQNGAMVECADITIAEANKRSGSGNITVTDATLKTGQIYFVNTGNGNTASCKFNNAILVPTRANTSIFRNLSPEITAGTLQIDTSMIEKALLDTVVKGTGAFEVIGGGMVTFTAAPTYTGATKISDGALTMGELTHGSTVLEVAANGTYVTDVSDDIWQTITFADGAQVQRTNKADVLFTATTITGKPTIDGRYYSRSWTDEELQFLKIGYRQNTEIIIR